MNSHLLPALEQAPATTIDEIALSFQAQPEKDYAVPATTSRTTDPRLVASSEMMPDADSLASTRLMRVVEIPRVCPIVRPGCRDLPPHSQVFSRGRFSANCQ
jgi:hypothetical protein